MRDLTEERMLERPHASVAALSAALLDCWVLGY